MLGIEINPFAAELARVSVWIGEIQWMREHGFEASRNPILKSLDTIHCRDALLNDDGTEYEWPEADVIVGNPPFLGANKFKTKIGDAETEQLRATYKRKVPQGTDLVTYWFYKASNLLQAHRINAFGLVATSAIRAGVNLKYIDKAVPFHLAFNVWDDEPWVLDGANVRISIICCSMENLPKALNGQPADKINSDLTAFSFGGFAKAQSLNNNSSIAFQGSKKVGNFEVPGKLARHFITSEFNPHLQPNENVLKRSWLTTDFTQRDRDMWIIDFGTSMTQEEASLFEAPFRHIEKEIKARRQSNRRPSRSARWWLHGDPQPAMRLAIAGLSRYLVTPEVTERRIFVWAHPRILPDCKLMVIAKEDDITFGILQSRLHALWAKYNGGVRGRARTYTPDTTFVTFPFPKGLTPNIPAVDYSSDPRATSIAEAARRLNDMRENWLNPPDLVKRLPEVVPGYPDRIVPRDAAAAEALMMRTLTNLYNERPTWLNMVHKELDRAVAAAYGWTDWSAEGLPDDVILERLFKLNQERAAAGQ